MGMPSMPELLIFIFIGFVIWLLVKRKKKKTEKPLEDKENRGRNTKTKFCSECGAPLEEKDRFCPVCGIKVL